MKYLLIWLLHSVSQQLTSYFLVCLFGSSPSNTVVPMVYNVTYSPFCIALWLLLLHYVVSGAALQGKEPGTGRNSTIVSHQQSTRFTGRRDQDLGQSTNNLPCSSLFISLKQSGQLTPKRSHSLHQVLTFSSAPRWPPLTRPFDTCCLVVALVKQLVTIWWKLNRAVLLTSLKCVCVCVGRGGGIEGVWGGLKKNPVACEDKYGSQIQSLHLCYWPLPARLRQWHPKVTKGPIEGI